jgi:hypothetical protein
LSLIASLIYSYSMRLPLNQRGASQILLPLFLLAAIGLSVYLVQQRTDLIPSAQTAISTPTDCTRITPQAASRYICYKDGPTAALCKSSQAEASGENPEYKVKEIGYTWSNGWKSFSLKGAVTADGDRVGIGSDGYQGKAEVRFDDTSGKSYESEESKQLNGNSDYVLTEYKGGIAEYSFMENGTNFQGISGKTYKADKSFAFVPNKSGVNCGPGGGSTNNNTGNTTNNTTGSKKTGDTCVRGSDCQSGTCTNEKCDATGSKAGGADCTKAAECQSGTCTNNKCAGGTRSVGQSCDGPNECASNKCTDGKCVSAAASASPKATSSPKASSGSTSGGGASGGSTASTAPSGSTAPGASVPTASTPASTTPVSLTKAEITGFKASFDALDRRLGTASQSGNLNIVAGIARNELNSIVSQLPTCPDDANVGSCLDSKFRTRFDLAKTAARLSAFYAIFNNVSGICVKSDFGLNPLITATAQTGTVGRVNLCSEPTAARRIWKIFINGRFEDMLSTDTRFPPNPTCASLPQDVLAHYRNAETLFSTQTGFIQNSLCDGKTTVAPGGGT